MAAGHEVPGLRLGGAVVVTACDAGRHAAAWAALEAGGRAASMSSTAIVVAILSERFPNCIALRAADHGVLLFQDIAVVPCLILYPALARPQADLGQSMLIAAAQTGIVLLLLIVLGKRPMKMLLDTVAHRHWKNCSC